MAPKDIVNIDWVCTRDLLYYMKVLISRDIISFFKKLNLLHCRQIFKKKGVDDVCSDV